MEVNIENVTFIKYKDFWLAEILIKGVQTTFEIHSEILDRILVQKVLQAVENKTIEKLMEDSIGLLKQLSFSFWSNKDNADFSFSGFVIDSYNYDVEHDFKLCFHCAGLNGFSDFANWFIWIKDFKITGTCRQQL